VNLLASRWTSVLARAALCAAAIAALASCGSGAVSGSVTVTDPNRITILPGTATLYSGLPTGFVVSGGTGSYIISSSNQAVIPIAGSLPTNAFTVIPNAVTTDTDVTLTVRDTGSTPVATATLTVKPGTVGNNITITPSSTQGGSCAPAICSGGDAEVSVLLSQGGQPLVGRGVRFEVLSGDFRFITSQPGAPIESTDFTTTTVTDETGHARARIRVTANANNQTALLRVVDLVSGAFQTTSFAIAQATGTSPGYFASPSSITFSGPNDQECASSGAADVHIYGGTPPYTISTVGAPFDVSRGVVSSSGGSFSVLPRGVCVAEPGAPITIQDVLGRTTTVRVANVLGTRAVPALVVAPTTVAIAQCRTTSAVSVAGGTGVYTVSSGSGSVSARVVQNTVYIERVPNTAGVTPVSVGVTSGNSSATITVNVSGEALGTCDSSSFTVTPPTVTLGSCQPVTISLSGGSGNPANYVIRPDNSAVTAQAFTANSFQLVRTTGPQNFAGTATVYVSDGPSTRTVTVNIPAMPTSIISGPSTCP
jgi:hypothetical protein